MKVWYYWVFRHTFQIIFYEDGLIIYLGDEFMTKETKSKSMDWLKGVLSNQSPQVVKETTPHESEDIQMTADVEEPEKNTTSTNLLSKEDQDKVTLDLIVSLENMLKDRQLILYKNKDLEEQLDNANEMISKFKHDQVKREQLIQEKNKEISLLENKLTNKQMNYDQLLEDYKEFQGTSKVEYTTLSNQLEKQINKYNKLNEEATHTQYQNLLKINQYEDRIRELEVENQKLQEQFEQVLEEKNQLMKSINDFTERMSFSFTPKPPAPAASKDSE